MGYDALWQDSVLRHEGACYVAIGDSGGSHYRAVGIGRSATVGRGSPYMDDGSHCARLPRKRLATFLASQVLLNAAGVRSPVAFLNCGGSLLCGADTRRCVIHHIRNLGCYWCGGLGLGYMLLAL